MTPIRRYILAKLAEALENGLGNPPVLEPTGTSPQVREQILGTRNDLIISREMASFAGNLLWQRRAKKQSDAHHQLSFDF